MANIHDTRPMDRQEQVRVQRHEGYEHQTQVVEERGVEQRLAVSRVAQLIWLLFGILEALIGLRVVLKLIAANPANPFANLVYAFSDLFLWPFAGITNSPAVQGIVLDIPAIIAMFVYALLGWIIARLVWLLFYHPTVRTVRTIEREDDHVAE